MVRKSLYTLAMLSILLVASCADLDLNPPSSASSGNWYSDIDEITISINDFIESIFMNWNLLGGQIAGLTIGRNARKSMNLWLVMSLANGVPVKLSGRILTKVSAASIGCWRPLTTYRKWEFFRCSSYSTQS